MADWYATFAELAGMDVEADKDGISAATRQRVLAFLFGQPDRSFYATELIRLVAAGYGAVQRELARLEQSYA